MANKCVQCGKKIGFFQKAFDGAYCSPECGETAKREMAENQRKADELRVEAQRQASERQEHERAERELLSTCPKCGKSWQHHSPDDATQTHRGECPSCGFATAFAAIEPCPNCRSTSFVVAADGTARCPRCKHRKE